MYGAMLYFGTMFLLTQARYIFPVAAASALLAMLGLRAFLPERAVRPAAALTIAALVIGGTRGTGFWRTACLGAGAGTSFGLTATMMKQTISNGEDHGLVGVVTSWQTYVAVGFGVLGIVLMQWALHTGPLLAAQPGFTLMDPLVSILWGVLVFGEMTRTGPVLILAVIGAVTVGLGVRVLARSPLFDATHDTAADQNNELTAHATA